MKQKKSDDNRAQRMLVLDVIAPDEKYEMVLRSIRKYRAAARQAFGTVFCAYAAGAKLEQTDDAFRVLPDNDATRTILDNVFGKSGKAPLYSLRDWVRNEALGPDFMSFVWDGLRAVTWERWTARDPEFPKCSRSFLSLNGARGLAQLNNIGIQFPQLTGRPKLEGRSIALNWNHAIGTVTFSLQKLDGGRWRTFVAIRDGEYKPGTLTLNERDGKLRVLVTYSLTKDKDTDLDPNSSAALEFNSDGIKITAGLNSEALDYAGALRVLMRLKQQKHHLESGREACGAKNRSWGNRKAFVSEQERIGRLTKQRDNVVNDWNHAWTRRIVAFCRTHRCGRLCVPIRPDNLGGEPWQWSGFEKNLEYKADFVGIEVDLK